MSFKFEKLVIWQKAMDIGEEVNSLAEKFPKKEIYDLSSQLRRAADSIALNEPILSYAITCKIIILPSNFVFFSHRSYAMLLKKHFIREQPARPFPSVPARADRREA